MPRILVTGGSGFVGRVLARMAAAGVPGSPGVPVALPEAVDLRDAGALAEALRGIEAQAVIHLAAITFVPESFARPQETCAVNTLGTINLLQGLASRGFEGPFLYVSSGDVYGRVPAAALPVSEDRLPAPRSPYAASKLAAEAFCYQASQTSGVRAMVARPFNHIGPGQSERFVVSGFARQIAEVKLGRRAPVIEVGDLDVTRDFSDVRDVVRAYLMLLERGEPGETYNVCSGVERDVGGLLRTMLGIAGVGAELRVAPERLRPVEQRRMCGSNARLRRATGWEPRFGLEDSLRDTLDYWEAVLKNG